VVLKVHNIIFYWWAPLINTYSLLVCTYIFWRVAMSMFYREPQDAGYMPSVSMIISAKNEEHHIRETLEHVFASRYPRELLEVLVVDDGSTDRTWEILEELSFLHPRRLRTFRHETNKGKRFAMALGAQKAQNEILVYIDSDSLIDPEALYRVVQPFHDRSIGAVGGEIGVVVEKDNFFSKMEVVRYQISQRVIKASESLFNSVTCCSGPLAAYRRVSVLRVLPAWLNQTFRGRRTTFGDDRSLTNFILRTHRVVFHHGAICRTYVPNRLKTYLRQQLRWKKSWSRETIIASGFMWRKHPMAAVPFYLGILVTLLSPLIALRALFYLPVFLSVSCLPYLTGLALINFLLASVFFYYTRSRYWPYLLAFVAFYIGILSWQTYYAITTIPRNHWGTR
jgi:hyaluronan synthase